MKRKILASVFVFFCLIAMFPISGFAADASPLPPKDLTADVKNGSVSLNWTTPVDTSVAGFNIYRKDDLTGGNYVKINSSLLTGTDYNDGGVRKGVSYSYICKSVNADGIESIASNISGAPKMKMNTSAVVYHMGRVVRIAAPGDEIKYNIEFTNYGFGIAKDVVIVYAIPKGTTFISGTARCPKYKVSISYFDEKAGKWISKVSREEDVSKVKFSVLEDVPPIAKDINDIASLKVMVNY